jgi:alpha-galactosidase
MSPNALSAAALVVACTCSTGQAAAALWTPELSPRPVKAAEAQPGAVLELIRQDYEQLERGRSIMATPLVVGSRRFEHGLGTHSVSHIRIYSPEPIERFTAWVGVDQNERTRGGQGSIVFSVSAGGRELYRSGILRGGDEPVRVDVQTKGVRVLDLHVGDAGDGPTCGHAGWAEAAITTRGGTTVLLDELRTIAEAGSRYPFSFIYAGRRGDDLLDAWKREETTEKLDDGRTRTAIAWTDPETGLRVECVATRFADFPATEWLLYVENTGNADTPIIEELRALDVTLEDPLSSGGPYRLHTTNGAPSNPTDFEPRIVVLDENQAETLGAGGGRSSNNDFPFFTVETGHGALVVAVGWSGQWQARFEAAHGGRLRVTAGLERTHFLLHPGERVRTPRILVLSWEGDAVEAKAQFRQLVYKHYAARRNGERQLPTLFCNTCFTRGGGWLNECTAENQIALIRAYGKLGLEAMLTDAGWFVGGWPEGAGNWTPDPEKYPDGMGPVAAAAKAEGMVYGLWFEPERVVPHTAMHTEHPDWCLRKRDDPNDTLLADFGRPEVRDYFFAVVEGFMKLPGFRFYRQDFNMDPLPYWRATDAPDRQGITEMRYIEGLYAYWDRIAEAWPDSIREECASGGRRIDLETVMRMHLHQKTDYWFDDDVDQASLWALSRYLPSSTVVAHLNRLDDYSFHSTLASSLCLGWIADAPDFDMTRAKVLVERYRAVRHLLVGAWYPLLPYSRDPEEWIGSQYHRSDLDEGLLLVFRHAESPSRTAEVSLHALDPQATYELRSDSTDRTTRLKGTALMSGWPLTIPEPHRSDLITYRKVTR